VRGPQQVGDVVHGRTGQQGEQLRLHFEEFSAERIVIPHAVTRQPPVRGVVGAGRQQVGVAELGHVRSPFLLLSLG